MKASVVGIGLMGAAALAWAGATHISSTSLENQLAQLGANPDLPPQLTVESVQRTPGFLKSTGTIRWEIKPGARQQRSASLPDTVHGLIRYTVHHTPGLSSLSRFEANVLPGGEFAELIKPLIGEQAMLVANGTMGIGGAWAMDFETAKVSYDSERINVRVPASTGSLKTDSSGQSQYSWQLARAAASTPEGRFFADGMTMKGVVTDARLGLGQGVLTVSSVQGPQFEVSNVSIDSKSTDNAGKIDSVMTTSVQRLGSGAQQYNDLGFSVALGGIDTESVRIIQNLVRELDGEFESIDNARALILEKALAKLLDTGLSIGIHDVAGKTAQGEFAGRVSLSLQPQAGGQNLKQRVKASGKVQAAKALVPPQFAQMLLSGGFVVEQGDKVTASFDLTDGQIELNGKPADPGYGAQLVPMLEFADMQLAQWRQGLDNGQSMISLMLPTHNRASKRRIGLHR